MGLLERALFPIYPLSAPCSPTPYYPLPTPRSSSIQIRNQPALQSRNGILEAQFAFLQTAHA